MQPSPPLKVSKQVTNLHSATKHSNQQHQKQTAEAAKNSSAPHARGGYRKRGYRKRRYRKRGYRKQRGAGSTVPTLSSTSGPPKSSPSAQDNIINSHETNAAIISKATNDDKVQAPKCKASQSGGGNAVKLGRFLESLHNMNNKIGGYKKPSKAELTKRKKERTRMKIRKSMKRQIHTRRLSRRGPSLRRRRSRRRSRRHRRRSHLFTMGPPDPEPSYRGYSRRARGHCRRTKIKSQRSQRKRGGKKKRTKRRGRR